MQVIGLMRVRDERRWIRRALEGMLRLCYRVIVLDDHSTDGTPEIAEQLSGVRVIRSRFSTIDEARDKNLLVATAEYIARSYRGESWALMLDGDEVLEEDDATVLLGAIQSGRAPAYSVQVMYLWGDERTVRVDGIYGRFHRPSCWRLGSEARFQETGMGPNLHCGSVPPAYARLAIPSGARVWHYGYMLRDDRIRKWRWYTTIDPQNVVEDGYRHIVQGDVPEVPADARLRHAGPLRLERAR